MPPPEIQSADRFSDNACTAAQIAFNRMFGSGELGYSGGKFPCNTTNSASNTSCNGTEGLTDEAFFAMTRKRSPSVYQACTIPQLWLCNQIRCRCSAAFIRRMASRVCDCHTRQPCSAEFGDR